MNTQLFASFLTVYACTTRNHIFHVTLLSDVRMYHVGLNIDVNALSAYQVCLGPT